MVGAGWEGTEGGSEAGFGSGGGGEGVRNEVGWPGRASCQFSKSARLRMGGGERRWGGWSRQFLGRALH